MRFRYEPPVVMMPASLDAAAIFEHTAEMIELALADPAEERGRGTQTRRLRLISAGGDARAFEVELETRYRGAVDTRFSETRVDTARGVLSETSERRLKVMGLTIKSHSRLYELEENHAETDQ